MRHMKIIKKTPVDLGFEVDPENENMLRRFTPYDKVFGQDTFDLITFDEAHEIIRIELESGKVRDKRGFLSFDEIVMLYNMVLRKKMNGTEFSEYIRQNQYYEDNKDKFSEKHKDYYKRKKVGKVGKVGRPKSKK